MRALNNDLHSELLDSLKRESGTPTKHTFSDRYLGTSHPRYAISNPKMRVIARSFMRAHDDLDPDDFSTLLTALIHAESSSEKMMAAFLLDYARPRLCQFKVSLFDDWLDHLMGWAEVDALCTGKYAAREVLPRWKAWKPLLVRWSKNKKIEKRRASLVMLCMPLRKVSDDDLVNTAFAIVSRLSSERDGMITKAISWLLRSMIPLYRTRVKAFVNEHCESLPAIAVRETRTKLATGTKTGQRKLS